MATRIHVNILSDLFGPSFLQHPKLFRVKFPRNMMINAMIKSVKEKPLDSRLMGFSPLLSSSSTIWLLGLYYTMIS